MPKLGDIKAEHHDSMKLNGIPWFAEAANHPGLVRGGIYLLSGVPKAGKTTLALQMAVDIACRGQKTVYVALEQSPSDLKQIVENRIFPHRRAQELDLPEGSHSFKQGLKQAQKQMAKENEEERVQEHLSIDDSVNGMEDLPDFLVRQVLRGRNYAGTDLIIVDSLQGLGTTPLSAKPYQRLFEFNRFVKEHRITAILIGHVTKAGAIAGPRSLEHNVDCVFYLRKAMRLRPLFVPMSRLGPERYEPLTLIMNEYGCLEKSRHVKARASNAFGYLPGASDNIIEVQALVKLPKFGERSGIKTPYLPKQKMNQLITIVGSLRDIDISELIFEINCAIPGGRPYYHTLDLPLAMSMLSSYFQRAIPSGTMFVGEIDLFQNVRPLPERMCEDVANVFSLPDLSTYHHCIERVYISSVNEKDLLNKLKEKGLRLEVHGVANLENVVGAIWPDVMDVKHE